MTGRAEGESVDVIMDIVITLDSEGGGAIRGGPEILEAEIHHVGVLRIHTNLLVVTALAPVAGIGGCDLGPVRASIRGLINSLKRRTRWGGLG